MLLFLVISHAFAGQYTASLGYNEVSVAKGDKMVITGKIGTSLYDYYIVFHNPDYFAASGADSLATIYKNKEKIEISTIDQATFVKFHLIQVVKEECDNTQFVLNYHPEPIYPNLSIASVQPNYKYCWYLLSSLSVTYNLYAHEVRSNEILNYTNNGTYFAVSDRMYVSNGNDKQVHVILYTNESSSATFGINYIMVNSKIDEQRLAHGPFHYGEIDEKTIITFIHSKNGMEVKRVSLSYNTELTPGIHDLEIAPGSRTFTVPKNSFVIMSQTFQSRYTGYIENGKDDIQIFSGIFKGRVIRFARKAKMIIKSDNYPLLRVTVFDTSKHPFCKFHVGDIGMSSMFFANSIPPGNLTATDAASFCLFYPYPYQDLDAEFVKIGDRFRYVLYDIHGRKTSDAMQPVMLYLTNGKFKNKTFQFGVKYKFYNYDNYANGLVSTTLNPYLIIVGTYIEYVWIIVGVICGLLLIAIVSYLIWRRKKKTAGYSEISEAEPMSL